MIDEEQRPAVRKEDVLGTLSRISAVGRAEALATADKLDTPLAAATTPSLEALKAYTTAAEFEKIVDHRGIVISEPVGALARLQLSYSMVGNETKAKLRIATSSVCGTMQIPAFLFSNEPG